MAEAVAPQRDVVAVVLLLVDATAGVGASAGPTPQRLRFFVPASLILLLGTRGLLTMIAT